MRPSRPIELVLLRQWASYVGTPVFIVNGDGDLAYYNEPAEVMLGRPFDRLGSLAVADLHRTFDTQAADGTPLGTEGLPLAVALRERRPVHVRLRFRAVDERRHTTIDVTAFPLIRPVKGDHDGDVQPSPLGAVAIFWMPRV